MAFWEKLQKQFKEGSVLTRIILINAGIFVIITAIYLISTLGGMDKSWIRDFMGFPADWENVIQKPWTLVTYMFTHIKFFHFLFNMIALYIFGQLFVKWQDQNKLLSLYIMGGICGAAMFLFVYTVFPGLVVNKHSSSVVGASASIYAVMVAVAVLVPKHKVGIPFIVQLELRQLVLAFLALDVLSIAFDQMNIGGHFAHLGGALLGFLFGILYKKGIDITSWLNSLIKIIQSLFNKRDKMKVTYKRDENKTRRETDMEYNARKKQERDEVNRILDKIGKSGYESLTKKEKEILFKSSNKK